MSCTHALSCPVRYHATPQHLVRFAYESSCAALGRHNTKKHQRPIDSRDSRAHAFSHIFLENVWSPTQTFSFNEGCEREGLDHNPWNVISPQPPSRSCSSLEHCRTHRLSAPVRGQWHISEKTDWPGAYILKRPVPFLYQYCLPGGR